MKKIFDEIIIVTNSPKDFVSYKKDCLIVEDVLKNIGPLGGIHSGLTHTSKEAIFFVACDMPFLRKDLIKRLLNASTEEDWDAVVPSTSGGIEPLHAVYSKNNLGIIEDLLKGEDFSILKLLKRCKCRYIEVNKEEESSFLNLNIPEDLKKLGPNG